MRPKPCREDGRDQSINIACPLDLHEVARGGFDQTEGPLVKLVARALGVRAQDIVCVRVLRRSIDARKKTNVHFIVSAAVKLCDETQERQSLEAGKRSPTHRIGPSTSRYATRRSSGKPQCMAWCPHRW